MSDIPLLPAAFTDSSAETPALPPPDELQTVPPKARHRSLPSLSKVVGMVTFAVIFASFGVFFDDLLTNDLLPDGYVLNDFIRDVPLSLEASAHLLPLSKQPLEETVTDERSFESTSDVTVIPEGELRIVEYDFSGSGLSNETSRRPDLDSLLNKPLPFDTAVKLIPLTAEMPEVLIIHTHGSEAYTAEDKASYPADSGMRSYDTAENVVAVGSVISERLNANGVDNIHITTMFDKDSYYNSYNRSLEAVKSCLAQYPSIKYVIDVHRDAAADVKKGLAYKPVTEIDGKKCAQLMLVVGTDELGASHFGWQDNLSIALKINEKLRKISPSLVRPINLRGASFNQQYAKGSLLLEVGSCANTLAEAKRAGEYFADSLAELIKNGK